MLKSPTLQVSVHKVASKKEKSDFLNFPYVHYAHSPHWVPPLRLIEQQTLQKRQNPFLEHSEIEAFIATDQNGKVVGRIGAIKNNMHLQKYHDATGFFGFFECIDDKSVSKALLDTACHWLKERGLKAARGPASPSMNDLSGLLVRGFDSEPYFFMPYNPAYYESHITQCGFTRAMTMSAYYIHKNFLKLERTMPALEAVYAHHPNMRVRTLNPKKMLEEVRTVVKIHNDAFTDNWGHVPYTEAEFAQLAKLFKYFIDPELVLFLEVDSVPVGFTVCFPNYNEALCHLRDGSLFPFGWLKLLLRTKFGAIHNVRSVLTGVERNYRGHGFDAVLCFEGAKRAMQKRYQGCELSWILESNRLVINSLEAIGAVRNKEYAMYELKW